MADSAQTFSYKNQSDIARANRFAHMADTTLQVGLRTVVLDPLGGASAYDPLYSWYDIGIVDGEANWEQAVETYKAVVGSPSTTRGVIKTQHTVSGAFSCQPCASGECNRKAGLSKGLSLLSTIPKRP